MKKYNEEDYLDSLLKSVNNKEEESDDDKEERLLKEEIKEAVEKTNLKSEKEIIEYDNLDDSNDSNDSNNSEASDQVDGDENSNESDDLEKDDIHNEDKDNTGSLTNTDSTGTGPTGAFVESQDIANELGDEYNHLFEPESDNFKISDIPDRDPEELTDSEIERLANMDLDEFLKGIEDDDTSVNSLLGAGSNISSTNIENEKDNLRHQVESQHNAEASATRNTVKSDGVANVEDEVDLLNTDGIASLEKTVSEIAGMTGDVGGLSSIAVDATSNIGMAGSVVGGVISESVAVAAAAAEAMGSVDSKKEKKKTKKEKKAPKDKKIKKGKNGNDSNVDGENPKTGKKFSILKFIRDIFFEEIEEPRTDKPTINSSEPKDENERVLRELYGNTEDGEIDESQIVAASKKGFFSKKGGKSPSDEVEESLDEEELELQNKKNAKKEKKAAAKAKKAEEKQAKKDKKPPKVKKAPKPKKEKKPKPKTRRQDMIKIKPGALILLIMFVSGTVIFVQISNTAFQYQNVINKANEYFQKENYQKAFDYLEGVELKENDKALYEQIVTIMYVQKQYDSYENYMELGMGVEALDSLVKGISRYYEFHEKAKELGVENQLEDSRAHMIEALKNTFAISEAKAISYAALAEEDFVQYYYTLESYGGMINNDSDN